MRLIEYILIKMKRLELTSFYLKLNELKEYDQAKQERQEAATKEKESSSQSEMQPEKINTRTTKTKQEIHARIGLNPNESS
ncbi:hypothetical protein PVAND_013749 [Polypedilum vanderplanki]|uniref:Uncharacterized protein n=1 Tax=Polypedilum vanderplanki TaxID=319348 RepID=A0A9J6CRF6_POLVA|nr:hypothetical protein PVAND_013749 [Polypedilum vanderplanki]